jgi:eukaryotic-like serine/threonine-protein kinase
MSTKTIRDASRVDVGNRFIGRTIDQYRVVRLLGKGGMGSVYEAVNTQIQKRVAMKVIDQELAQNEEATARFQREALAASAVESPHIVQIFDAGSTDDGVPYIVMEMLPGRDLGKHLNDSRPLEVVDAVHVTIQILKGLHHAHTAGIVHRDLKPDNVFLVEREDEPYAIKLLDFGVSKIARASGAGVPLETLTRQGTVVGTPFYMSPEQAQAFPDVDGRTDIYSVGAILYECLTGEPPHMGKSYEQVIVNICMHDAKDVRESNPQVPEGVASVIRRALRRERDERYPTARAMLEALVQNAPDSLKAVTPSAMLLRGLSLSPDRSTPSPQSPPTTRKDRVVVTPASHRPSALAETVRADSGGGRAIDATDIAVTSTRPIVEPQAVTTASDEPVSLPGVRRRRLWPLAVAPGVALLLGVVIYIQVGSGTRGDASMAEAPSKAAPAAPALADDAHSAASTAEPIALAPPPPQVTASATATPAGPPVRHDQRHAKADPANPPVATTQAGPPPPPPPPLAKPQPQLELQNK